MKYAIIQIAEFGPFSYELPVPCRWKIIMSFKDKKSAQNYKAEMPNPTHYIIIQIWE